MTVSSIAQLEGPGLTNGAQVTDGTATLVNGSTTIVSQLTGSIGGTGTYQISPSQTVLSETMYVGVRTDLAQTEWVVQCDVHGPNSANVTQTLITLFRSEVAVMTFSAQGTTYTVEPLYADDGKYMPFINAEQQYEYRWVIELHVQVNPVVGTTQQFADELNVTLHDLQ